MDKWDYPSRYFSPRDTLFCGQIFRFEEFEKGFMALSGERACYIFCEGDKTVCLSEDGDYFYNFFDIGRDYSKICAEAERFDIPLLSRSSKALSGLRLLNQLPEEMIYSFIISQNNNIPRIKGIISRICAALGEKREFLGREYFAFPTTKKLAEAGREFFKSVGCGYRDIFLEDTAKRIDAEGIERLKSLNTRELKKELLTYKGIGGKVADCVALFGFSRRDCFPVDTWIEKAYREDFGGTLKDRDKISEYFCGLFKDNSGYMQQYLFYGKRENL